MPSKILLAATSPFHFAFFVYALAVQACLIIIKRILLPSYPRYQSLRVELQRAYLSSASLYFPEFTHRLPAEYSTREARPVHGKDWKGYLIPGDDASILDKVACRTNYRIILYAHGGGYARGVARMYVPYMKRWILEAKAAHLDLVFLSVEYSLSTEAAHPAQRKEFLSAYDHLLKHGIANNKIVFMGDSAGGGICINSALYALRKGIAQPACSILVSPWLDMTMTSLEGGNQAVMSDYFVQVNTAVPALARLFIGEGDAKDPDLNPLYKPENDMKGLNPQLIFVGGAEFALFDSKEWAKKCYGARVEHELHVGWGQLHIWAMGSAFIDPQLRRRTDQQIFTWIAQWTTRR